MVFLTFSWIHLIIYSVASTAELITLILILTWMLWTINSTISDRDLLKNIVMLTLAGLAYSLVFSFLMEPLFLNDIIVYISLGFPVILIDLTRVVLIARLFRQNRVIVIDDEIRDAVSSELL